MEFAGCAQEFAAAPLSMSGRDIDIIVIDLEVSDIDDILKALQQGLAAHVVVITGSDAVPSHLDRAVLAGLRGIVRKNDPAPVLLKAIEKVYEGELWIDRSATSRIFMEMARQKSAHQHDPEQMKIATLTTREREMIIAVAHDTSAPGKVIASRLCISEHTLRNHLSSIYSKLGLSNRLDLYAYATRHSLDKPS
jgi:two-component system, NarL family, nitrate/nitrite response regulator NarL